MSDLSHEEMESSIAAFLLGAMEAGEEELLHQHLAGCASCRQLADRLGRAVGALPLATDEFPAPARLRGQILAAAAAVPMTEARPPARRARVLRLPRPGRGRFSAGRRGIAPLAGAAAVAALLSALAGMFAWDVSLSNQLASHRVYRATAIGSGPLAGARAQVVEFRGDGVALVTFESLPSVAVDRVYELWLIDRTGKAVPAGVFQPDPGESKVVVLDKDLSGYKAIALTVEQGPDGSLQPSQQPGLLGNLP